MIGTTQGKSLQMENSIQELLVIKSKYHEVQPRIAGLEQETAAKTQVIEELVAEIKRREQEIAALKSSLETRNVPMKTVKQLELRNR